MKWVHYKVSCTPNICLLIYTLSGRNPLSGCFPCYPQSVIITQETSSFFIKYPLKWGFWETSYELLFSLMRWRDTSILSSSLQVKANKANCCSGAGAEKSHYNIFNTQSSAQLPRGQRCVASKAITIFSLDRSVSVQLLHMRPLIDIQLHVWSWNAERAKPLPRSSFLSFL